MLIYNKLTVMKEFIHFVLTAIIVITIIIGIIQGIFLVAGPDYKEGKYTMTYRVYYPNNPKEYTITNNWPISIDSYRGTNIVRKTKDNKPFRKMFNTVSVFRTSAPIEVVSYTYKEF